ncbi:helix-turn-helix domain-containing protein [Hahella sp. HN01]|uniref:helix-turn-helix domain-containing protein n=1 Tax=Hahella sp. HN01 TaxID=2847262 RepID=UPI001C1EB538|nr:helix-turn-helix domain-containing protein [Hahella sp. HN01]MBU6954592.1 helix-turn-helix domain-containing protein [Hahella sp. HN01]
MITWKHQPEDAFVSRYIECYWFLRKDKDDIAHDSPKLNPCPEAHLIIAPPEQSYTYSLCKRALSGKGTHLKLPNTSSMTLHQAEPFAILGVKFKPGALYSIANGFAAIDDVISPPGFLAEMPDLLREDVLNNAADDAVTVGQNLDAWFKAHSHCIREDRHSRLARDALTLLATTKASELETGLYRSLRAVQRAFVRVTGLTPKQYQIMVRLDELLLYLYQQNTESMSWADVAAIFGFTDQPHLIRYFKKLIGDTPHAYRQAKNLTIDAYGDFE